MQKPQEEKNGNGEKRGAEGGEPAFLQPGGEGLGAMQLRGYAFAAGTPDSGSIAHRRKPAAVLLAVWELGDGLTVTGTESETICQ